MKNLIQFRDNNNSDKFHPIMIACRLLSAFHHIHPFTTGNGRVGRLIMALYLIRNDYPPVIFHQINQEEYNSTLFMSQVEKDSTSLYALVIVNILNSFIKICLSA
jgi:Fic family protein